MNSVQLLTTKTRAKRKEKTNQIKKEPREKSSSCKSRSSSNYAKIIKLTFLSNEFHLRSSIRLHTNPPNRGPTDQRTPKLNEWCSHFQQGFVIWKGLGKKASMLQISMEHFRWYPSSTLNWLSPIPPPGHWWIYVPCKHLDVCMFLAYGILHCNSRKLLFLHFSVDGWMIWCQLTIYIKWELNDNDMSRMSGIVALIFICTIKSTINLKQ